MFRSVSLHRSVRIDDSLWAYLWAGMGNNCNTSLFPNVLDGDRPHVIVDPGMVMDEVGELCFESLIAAMEKDGFNAKDIGLIINTHGHPDHCDANAAILELGADPNRSRIEVAMSQEDNDHRKGAGNLYAMFGIDPPQFEPTFYLTEGDLKLGKLNFRVIHAPGHTPGSMCLYWVDHKVLIPGDVIFFGSVGRTDFPGGNTSLLKQSIEKLSQFDIELVIAGHSTEYGAIIQGKDIVQRNFDAVKSIFW